jgi:tetratricopeptide (TPR) repeat protein
MKLLVVSFSSGILLISILLQSTALIQNLEAVHGMQQERGKVIQEIQYWKQAAEKYKGYRDVYFRIAALEYKVGDMAESKKYMEKALELDPNFEAGRILGEKIKK